MQHQSATTLASHKTTEKGVPAICQDSQGLITQLPEQRYEPLGVIDTTLGRNTSLCFPEQLHLVPLGSIGTEESESLGSNLLQLFLAGWARAHYVHYLSCNFLFSNNLYLLLLL